MSVTTIARGRRKGLWARSGWIDGGGDRWIRCLRDARGQVWHIGRAVIGILV